MTFGKCERPAVRSILIPFKLFLLLFPVLAWSQTGEAPDYITSMSDYQVRSLSGAYAPSNGTSSMASITPQEWLDNDPGTGDLGAVITHWNGGAKGVGNRLFVHGGGHNGSANNGMYTFDFSGTSAPLGWETPLVISPVSAVINTSPTYADGKPTSTHTGDSLVYAHHNNHIYRCGGAMFAVNGGFTSACFKYNVATETWTRLPDYPQGGQGVLTFYDPVSGNIFFKTISSTAGYFFRTDNDTWSESKPHSSGLGFYTVGTWDSTRKRGAALGGGNNRVFDIDFQSETVSDSPISASGATTILDVPAISAVYDPQLDVYWMFGGDDGSPGWSTIYSMNADGPPWTVTAHKLSGDSIEVIEQWGSYGRFILMDKWRAIGLLGSHTSSVYVIKLPGEIVVDNVGPKAPTELIVE